MFPAWPPPEGAKSVFSHNLHSLTRPSLILTGAHGVAFMKHSTSITLPFSLSLSLSFSPLFFFFFFREPLDNLCKHLPIYFHIPSLRSGWKVILTQIINTRRRSCICFQRQGVIQLQTFCCKCSLNRYQTAPNLASSWNVLHLVGMTETHCHLNSPPLCETCEWFRCVCVRGREGERGWIGAIAFEVGIWSSHLHLMPFRLLVLTRAKHLTRLGLIWWGHGVTPWPALSMFSKWNQLSHRAGERWRVVGRVCSSWLDWPRQSRSFTCPPIWSGVLAAQRTLHWCEAFTQSSQSSATSQLGSQAKRLVKTHSIDLERITNAPASYRTTLHFEDVCKRRLRQYTFSQTCVFVCAWPAGPLLRHLFFFASPYFLMFQDLNKI